MEEEDEFQDTGLHDHLWDELDLEGAPEENIEIWDSIMLKYATWFRPNAILSRIKSKMRLKRKYVSVEAVYDFVNKITLNHKAILENILRTK